MIFDMDLLTCPYIDQQKAELLGTNYFCDFDNMEFDSMHVHCNHCEMYEQLIKNAMRRFEE